MNVGVNVQLGVLTLADVADLRRFAGGGVLLICDWPEHVPATLAVLDAAGVPVTMWRWTQSPLTWPDWPGDYLTRCRWSLFANEPDIEGYPDWYMDAVSFWAGHGGKVVLPAYSDESKRPQGEVVKHDAVSAHVYPLGLGAANLAAVRARAHGRPVFVSEYGVGGQQQTCLQRLAADAITEPTFLYTYRARDAQAQPQYDVAGVALLPATPGATKGPTTMPVIPVTNPAGIVAQDEGPTNLCWDVCAGECAAAAGGRSDVDAMYQAVKGVPYVAPGQPATFAELIHAVTWVAGYNGWQVQWYGTDGRINDWATFEAVVRGGANYVIAGLRGQALNLGAFGHFEAVLGIYRAPDGTDMVRAADSYAAYDNAGWQPSYPLQQYLDAMQENWDPETDAIGFRFALPAATAPAAPASVAAPAPIASAAIPADEQAAYAYYTQTKIGIDRSHALWTACLLPLYRRAHQLKAAGDPLADLVMPGPLAGGETGARWGGTRPAAIVRLTNQVVGVYQDADGAWHAYRPEAA